MVDTAREEIRVGTAIPVEAAAAAEVRHTAATEAITAGIVTEIHHAVIPSSEVRVRQIKDGILAPIEIADTRRRKIPGSRIR